MATEANPRAIVAIVGATASGKTGLSLDLAEALGGEIVNTDAMQLYRGMDVGTAKLPPSQRRGITHHLLDRLDVTQTATVADFQAWARDAIADIRDRGHAPVLVGGSALYTRAVLDRFEFPGTDESVRRELEAELEAIGPPALHRRLSALDADAAAKIGPDNGRRIVRALEVIALTGRPYSASLPTPTYDDPRSLQIGVDIDRPTLDARIGTRVREMYDDGLVEEVERLLDEGLERGQTARRAIGYREATQFLHGEISRDEALARTQAATRRFARRQDGWFRKDPRVVWVRFDDEGRVRKALDAVGVLDRSDLAEQAGAN
ncbi:tRNA (adenosine(37)-N6)-dimethylallyltransferase MiaA [Nocardioides currus]|uniref:tRNA dimethylallyltransferase n=1 Tax=Nocardioides currus TaxID=2133958 RepID=A0A2R7Z1K1_9ACTN|nr:tRNA (adenosine(37)-N6)-dimethylallyltransferase MiaA [Nocardioides currus]PUA82492.1 tRNA (adenosine(37)-N6)-dimethylallyltransferase MiaA [Nocardioides currus]